MEIITLPYIDASIVKRLLTCLNPNSVSLGWTGDEQTISANTIVSLISMLSIALLDVRKLILKWLCLTYSYTSNEARVSVISSCYMQIVFVKLYGCVFFLLDDEDCLPYTCHLLYITTVRKTVKEYRSRHLLSLFQHSLKTGQMIKPLYVMLQLYAQYDPSILLPRRPKMNSGYGQFQRIDEEWSERIRAVRQNRDSSDPNLTQLGEESTFVDFRMQKQVELEQNACLEKEERFFVWIIDECNV